VVLAVGESRRPRLLLLGLPMFAVFAAFGAIVWLAYEHGSQGPPVGEPPLVKAPATAIKLAPDESQEELAEGGEVLDMLSDAPPVQPLERLLPPPEEPLTPVEQAAEPPAPPQDEGADVAVATVPPPQTLTPPEPQPATVAQRPAPPPVVAPSPAVPREEPQTAAIAPQPTPEEAEAALDALLAEVTEQAAQPNVTPPAPSGSANGAAPSAVRPAVAPPAALPSSPASPPLGRPSGEVTAIAPDQRPGASPPPATTAARPGTSQVATRDSPYRIQLAAVRDEADARRAWDLFQVDLGSVLSGLEPFIERADTANGVFYRVQIGPFASLQDAEALCDQLKQRNASCFVIRR
jgi:cell division septation protein DedD